MSDKKNKRTKGPRDYDNNDYSYLLKKIGAPVNNVNLSVIQHWHNHEVNNRFNNPLSTTQPYKGADKRTIKNYDTRQHGLDATVDTILNAGKGTYYKPIRDSFKSSNAENIIKAITMSPWDNQHYKSGSDWKKGLLWGDYKGPKNLNPNPKIGKQFKHHYLSDSQIPLSPTISEA